MPIVFVQATDPVGAGRREPGAARRQRHRLYPIEYGMTGKWLELLKEIAPDVTRAAVIRDPTQPPGSPSWARCTPWRRRLGWW